VQAGVICGTIKPRNSDPQYNDILFRAIIVKIPSTVWGNLLDISQIAKDFYYIFLRKLSSRPQNGLWKPLAIENLSSNKVQELKLDLSRF
jgi:hypothetical protein